MMYRTHFFGPGGFWGALFIYLAAGGVLTWRFYEASYRQRAFWLAVYLFSSSLASVVISLVIAGMHGDAL